MCLCNRLLNQQQETINSFIRSLEEEFSQNCQQAQRLMAEQSSSNLPKSILGQVEALIEKEQQNASKLKVLEELNREAIEIAEEQHYRLEEVRLNLTTHLTSEVETSKPENYGGARPKTTSRTKLTSVAPSALPQEAMAPTGLACESKCQKSKLPLTVLAHLEHQWRVTPTPRKKVTTQTGWYRLRWSW